MQTIICIGSVHLSGLFVYKMGVQIYIGRSLIFCKSDKPIIDLRDKLTTGSKSLEHILMVGDRKNTLQI